MAQSVLGNHHAVTMSGGGYGLIRDAAVAIEDGRIAWVGPQADLPARYAKWDSRGLEGQLVTPGLIDWVSAMPTSPAPAAGSCPR